PAGGQEDSHRDTSRSKRSTNAPAGVDPSWYSESPASRNRARGADSAHSNGSTEKRKATPAWSSTRTRNSSRSSVDVFTTTTSRLPCASTSWTSPSGVALVIRQDREVVFSATSSIRSSF